MVIYNSPVEQKLWKPRGLFEGEALVRVRREKKAQELHNVTSAE